MSGMYFNRQIMKKVSLDNRLAFIRQLFLTRIILFDAFILPTLLALCREDLIIDIFIYKLILFENQLMLDYTDHPLVYLIWCDQQYLDLLVLFAGIFWWLGMVGWVEVACEIFFVEMSHIEDRWWRLYLTHVISLGLYAHASTSEAARLLHAWQLQLWLLCIPLQQVLLIQWSSTLI